MLLTMLMDFLHFTFDGFWHFVGVWLLIAVVFGGAANVVQAFRTKYVPGPQGAPGPTGMTGPQGRDGPEGQCRCNTVKH